MGKIRIFTLSSREEKGLCGWFCFSHSKFLSVGINGKEIAPKAHFRSAKCSRYLGGRKEAVEKEKQKEKGTNESQTLVKINEIDKNDITPFLAA